MVRNGDGGNEMSGTGEGLAEIIRAIEIKIRQLHQLHNEKAGAELGQAQLKLGLDFTLIFCSFS